MQKFEDFSYVNILDMDGAIEEGPFLILAYSDGTYVVEHHYTQEVQIVREDFLASAEQVED